MKVLTCEVCGGHQIKKESGAFVCQECGCQYSLEEAKSLLVDMPDSVQVAVSQTDSSSGRETIERYMNLASRAYESSNMEEAEFYGNKALELDDSLWKAWFFKGAGAGWQSTRTRMRFQEMANCFDQALSLCDDLDLLPELKVRCSTNLNDACTALIMVLASSFARVPDDETYQWIRDALATIRIVLDGFASRHTDLPIYCPHEILSALQACVVKGNNKVNIDYKEQTAYNDDVNLMFRERYLACLLVCELAQDFCPDNDREEDAGLYNAAITICDNLIELSVYKNMLKDARNSKKKWTSLWTDYLKRDRARAIRDYWAAHENERTDLERDFKRLNRELDAIINEPGYPEMIQRRDSLNASLKELERQEYLLLPFSSRSKKRDLRERIEQTKAELEEIQRSIGTSEKDAQILTGRIEEINARLQDPLREL